MAKEKSCEKLREHYLQKYAHEELERKKLHKEQEQKRLNDIFSILGSTNKLAYDLTKHRYEPATLDKIRNDIDASDRKSMLTFLAITADALDNFEVLPEEVREALADGLQKIIAGLGDHRGFLPLKRGERSKSEKQTQSEKEYWTAFHVEYLRYYDKISLEDAVAQTSEDYGLTESLIHKRWKSQHKNASITFRALKDLNLPGAKLYRKKK